VNYLITGGTGFIGPYIAKLLIKEGHGVVVYDLNTNRQPLEKIMGKEASDKVKVVKGDITDLANLIHAVKDNDVNKIIHMAALLTGPSAANPTLAMNVNCYGTLNVLETARILSLKKVVYASTGALFGPPEVYGVEYIPNDAPHMPMNLYGACKSFVESLAKHYLKDFKVDSVGLRFPLPYGPGMTGGAAKFIDELIVKPALGKPGVVPNGDGIVNWLYVEDAARAVYIASNAAPTPTSVFNVNCDVHSVSEAANIVRKLIPGADLKLIPGSHGLSLKWDASRIEKELGYIPEYSLEKAFKEIVDDARKRAAR
jgi:UDP-glucose 4-epimerase